MEKIYLQFAEFLGKIAALEFEISEYKRSLEEIRDELMDDVKEGGGFGVDLSAHAFTNIANRLTSLASDSSVIHKDLFNVNKHAESLIWPPNMRAFVIGVIANARSKNEFSIKDSKNVQGGKEYHYEIEIKKWSTKRNALVFVAIVESNVIKTGFFNWIERHKMKQSEKS